AVALNLVTVGAAFGLLSLLVNAPGHPVGDAGFVDAISGVAIFVITFGLSIDYEVFLLSRMREGWERTRDTTEAIDYGVRHTAGVITGAASGTGGCPAGSTAGCRTSRPSASSRAAP